jgi:hypothetical protein
MNNKQTLEQQPQVPVEKLPTFGGLDGEQDREVIARYDDAVGEWRQAMEEAAAEFGITPSNALGLRLKYHIQVKLHSVTLVNVNEVEDVPTIQFKSKSFDNN